MVKVIAWDIGGANIKAVFAEGSSGIVVNLQKVSRYLPIWRVGKQALEPALKEHRLQQAEYGPIDLTVVAMTAELSDVYATKREGVNHILDCVEKVHRESRILVLASDGELRSVAQARSKPLDVASSNWPATGWLASRYCKTCLVVDVGSTTTSIIPVVDGHISARGKTDIEKLACGELVYTGALRTNVAAILKKAHISGRDTRISSEFFASSADVHSVLGNIAEEDYTTETADGRGRTKEESIARLARVVCADVEMLTQREVEGLAQEAYTTQTAEISKGLKQVIEGQNLSKDNTPILVAGLGRFFLAEKAARMAGFNTILDLESLTGFQGTGKIASALGLALMGLSHLTGWGSSWTPSLR